MGKPENYVESYLYSRVRASGGLCLKFMSSISGVPDRIVILAGRTVFVETKALGKKPRKLQLVRFNEMRVAGADVRVIDSRELVEELISELLASSSGSSTLRAVA
ncbi:VRR-NUC domain-containing protein [Plantibacter flavus]|nr:VRR-NUC domain-containing protein [Plantibacter flavus]